jgi:hypothetical protein
MFTQKTHTEGTARYASKDHPKAGHTNCSCDTPCAMQTIDVDYKMKILSKRNISFYVTINGVKSIVTDLRCGPIQDLGLIVSEFKTLGQILTANFFSILDYNSEVRHLPNPNH